MKLLLLLMLMSCTDTMDNQWNLIDVGGLQRYIKSPPPKKKLFYIR